VKDGAPVLHAHVVALAEDGAVGGDEAGADGDAVLGEAGLCFGEGGLEARVGLHGGSCEWLGRGCWSVCSRAPLQDKRAPSFGAASLSSMFALSCFDAR
jgi:hypothetical protein